MVVDGRAAGGFHTGGCGLGADCGCPGPEDGDEPDVGRYLEFVRAQVRELCTQYGEIHGFL